MRARDLTHAHTRTQRLLSLTHAPHLCRYDQARVDLIISLLTSLLNPQDQRRLLSDLTTATSMPILPLTPLTDEGGPPTLASALKSFEVELGGTVKINSLIERLKQSETCKDDPRPNPTAQLVVDADVALLFILDTYDASQSKVCANEQQASNSPSLPRHSLTHSPPPSSPPNSSRTR